MCFYWCKLVFFFILVPCKFIFFNFIFLSWNFFNFSCIILINSHLQKLKIIKWGLHFFYCSFHFSIFLLPHPPLQQLAALLNSNDEPYLHNNCMTKESQQFTTQKSNKNIFCLCTLTLKSSHVRRRNRMP